MPTPHTPLLFLDLESDPNITEGTHFWSQNLEEKTHMQKKEL